MSNQGYQSSVAEKYSVDEATVSEIIDSVVNSILEKAMFRQGFLHHKQKTNFVDLHCCAQN